MSIISKKSAEHYKWGDNCDGWHLVKTNELSIIQELVPPGCSEARHYHKYSNQFFFILSGIATFELNDELFELDRNNSIFVPAGSKHKLSNNGESDLHFTVTSTPPSHGDKFEI